MREDKQNKLAVGVAVGFAAFFTHMVKNEGGITSNSLEVLFALAAAGLLGAAGTALVKQYQIRQILREKRK